MPLTKTAGYLAPLLFFCTFSASPSYAQEEPGKLQAYSVVSIKPNKSGNTHVSKKLLPDGIAATNVEVRVLLADTYGVRLDLISGLPKWAADSYFDIEARMDADDTAAMQKLNREQKEAATRQMVQAMLRDRFHLQAHIETKQLPVYELVIAKGGPRITDVSTSGRLGPDGKPLQRMVMGPQLIDGKGVPLAGVMERLSNELQRNVIDKTGLAGRYDLHLDWSSDHDGAAGADAGISPADAAPSIFTAVEEQLGLKLIPSKGPVNTLVVDHVEMPTMN